MEEKGEGEGRWTAMNSYIYETFTKFSDIVIQIEHYIFPVTQQFNSTLALSFDNRIHIRA